MTIVSSPDAPEPRPISPPSRAQRGTAIVPGLVLCAGIAAVATILGRLVPVIGAPVCGIVLGVALGIGLRRYSLDVRLQTGVGFSSRIVLQLAIVVLGSGLSLAEVVMTRRRDAVVVRAAEGASGEQVNDPTTGIAPSHRARRGPRLWQLVPWFLIGFLLAAALNSLGGVPQAAHSPLSTLSLFLITMALSGIGLSTRPRQLRNAGLRPLALGAILWATVGISSLLLQAATGMH